MDSDIVCDLNSENPPVICQHFKLDYHICKLVNCSNDLRVVGRKILKWILTLDGMVSLLAVNA